MKIKATYSMPSFVEGPEVTRLVIACSGRVVSFKPRELICEFDNYDSLDTFTANLSYEPKSIEHVDDQNAL